MGQGHLITEATTLHYTMEDSYEMVEDRSPPTLNLYGSGLGIVEGVEGNAVGFAGGLGVGARSTAHLSAHPSGLLPWRDGNGFTVSVWVQLTWGLAQDGTIIFIGGQDYATATADRLLFELWMSASDRRLHYRWFLPDGSEITSDFANVSGEPTLPDPFPNDGKWHLVTVTGECISTDFGMMRVYLDGVIFGWDGWPGSLNQSEGTSADLVLGMRWDGSHPFRGALDDLTIYRGALTQSEVLANYVRGDQAPPIDGGTGESSTPTTGSTYNPGTGTYAGDFYMDPDTGDLAIVGGDVLVARGSTAVAQHVMQRLRTFLGEWFLDASLGVPYFETVFQAGANLQVVRTVLRRAILDTPGIGSVSDFSLTYDNARRTLTVAFSAKTDEGQVITIKTGLP